MELKGKVKWYDERKAFGFITADDGTEYFVHKSSVHPESKLFEGAEVSFVHAESKPGKKEPRAINVRLVA